MIIRNIKILSKSILVFIIVLMVMVIIHALFSILGMGITQEVISPEQLFIERLYPLAVAYLLIFWTRKKRKNFYLNFLKELKFDKKNIKYFFWALIVVLILLYANFILSGFLNHYKFINFGYEEYPFEIIIKQTLLVGIFANFIIAIGEEIIFRGFLMNYLIDLSKSKLFALLFTSVVFSLHPYSDILNYVIVFLAGLIMGYTYLKFRSLYIPIGIHFGYNLFNFTIASKPNLGPQLPYLMKFNYLRILDGLGAWVDLFIITGFLLIFFFFWWKKPNQKEKIFEMF